MTETKPFSLMVKPAGSACSMRCQYCYYIDNPESGSRFMSEEILEQTIRSYAAAASYPVLSYVWHGGEPTLRGIEFYKKAVELQRKYLPEGFECWNSLQTNGLALNDEWCQFLSLNHFDVGISIDGTRAIHDTYRHDAAGNPTYERIRNNITLLQKYGIQPDLLCTVTEDTARDAYQVYNSLKRLRTGWVQFIPIVNHDEDGNISAESVRPDSYGKFLTELFRLWLTKDFMTNDVQMFAELLNVHNGARATLCWLGETCGQALVIESDGGIYSCDHFVSRSHLLGNVMDTPLDQAVMSEQQSLFGNAKRDELSEKCRACPYLHLCHGGCPKDRFLAGRENWLCEGLYAFFEYSTPVYQRLLELLKQKVPKERAIKILRREKLI
jgi:uncharacterized protein